MYLGKIFIQNKFIFIFSLVVYYFNKATLYISLLSWIYMSLSLRVPQAVVNNWTFRNTYEYNYN